MRITAFLTGMLISLVIFSCKQPDPPNIVFIFADDLGWKDLGVYGSTFYETPNLDRLAAEGMLFTDAYSAAANCAPSRACLMTGHYTPRHGIFTVGTSERGRSEDRKIIPVQNTTKLDSSFITIAEELARAGYISAAVGKWHLGGDPRDQGFDVSIGGDGPKSYFAPYKRPPLEAPEGEYLTDRINKEAIGFIEENRNNRFFLYLAHYAVHTPLMAKQELIDKYRGKPGSQGQSHPVYAGMIESLDQNVGLLLQKLDELSLSENTIVFFTSDNGGIRSISSQQPLRAGKGSYYEGGIRVPLFVRWPGRIEAGSRSDLPVNHIDFYPTLVEVAGIRDPLNDRTDGISFFPLLRGEEGYDSERPLFWHFPIYLQAYNPKTDDGRDPVFRTRPGSVVRYGKWKLHEYYEDGGIELYNLKEDPGERKNLALEMPEKTRELYSLLSEWKESTSAPVPSEPNPDYDPQ